MAARLNTPADFTVSSQAGSTSRHGLLAPSMFITTKAYPSQQQTAKTEADSTFASEPWKDLAKATTKILTLKEENKKLRDERQAEFHCRAAQPLRACVDVHHDMPREAPAPSTVSAMDQVIQRQAAEIASLQQRLNGSETKRQKSESQMESQVEIRKAHHEQELMALQNEMALLKDRNAAELADRDAELSRVIASNELRLAELEVDLNKCRSEAERDVNELSTIAAELKTQLDRNVTELQETKRSKDAQVTEATQQLHQLKTYLTQTESAVRTQQVWQRDHSNMMAQIKNLEQHIDKLTEEIKLGTIRLQAQDRVLTIHESHLSNMKDASAEKKKTTLLTRWRQKVYELMVQAKMSDTLTKQQEHNWQLKFKAMTDETEALEGDVEVQRATLEEKAAQIKLAAHHTASLEGEVLRVQEVVDVLRHKARQDVQQVHKLTQFTETIYQQFSETLHHQAALESVLKAYDQRISFAAGRVCMLQGQFSRREARLRLQYEDQAPAETDIEDTTLINQELSRVTEERDALIQQQRQDADLFETIVATAKQKVEADVIQLEEKTSHMQLQTDLKNEEIDRLESDLSAVNAEVDKMRAQMDDSVKEKQEAVRYALADVENNMEAERVKMEEKLTEMERQVNNWRRQQTKAVVGLRQMERAAARQKEEALKHVTSVEADHRDAVTHLHRKLHMAEKDRDLLMTILREQGLVNEYKAQRAAPITAQEDQTNPVLQPSTSTHTEQDELHEVIDDLKALTAEIMDDSS